MDDKEVMMHDSSTLMITIIAACICLTIIASNCMSCLGTAECVRAKNDPAVCARAFGQEE